MTSKLLEKLREPEYRKAFVGSQINIGIPFQVRSILKARGKTQVWLAEKTGMLQPRISGLMTPGKTRPNIETLRRIAEAFDCGLAVRFVPFTELAEWSEEFDPQEFTVPDFDAEVAAMESRRASANIPRERGDGASRASLPHPPSVAMAQGLSSCGAGTQANGAATPRLRGLMDATSSFPSVEAAARAGGANVMPAPLRQLSLDLSPKLGSSAQVIDRSVYA
jgi:transcriptional regulator with XRE-family HTH domain